jgi:uncharacterized membrane protein YoaK (UPF0700 family)
MNNFKSDKILVAALIGMAIALELEQWLQGVLFVIVPTTVAFITILMAVLIITVHRKWVPIIPLVLSAFTLFSAFKSPDELDHLTHPFTLPFIAAVIGLVTMSGTFISAINATVQNYKS